MKINHLFFGLFIGLALASCTKMDEIVPASGTMLAGQVQETYANYPERAKAPFAGLFTDIGLPAKLYSTPDDWEFLMILFCNDLEGGDALIKDNNYNWFSVCGEYSSRSATYRNPAIRYRVPFNMIGAVNTFLGGFDEEAMTADPTENAENLAMMAQAKCLRAYSYMLVAPQYQFAPNTYVTAEGDYGKNLLCVPIITNETEDFANNPRATVQEVYDIVTSDLDWAVKYLDGYKRTSKMNIDQSVAYGLRARVNLLMGNWQAAYDDAVAAAKDYTPASIADVSKPAFYDISESNWMWGYDMTTDNALRYRYGTTSSWLRSFSAWSYSAAVDCYTCINKLLWDLIPSTDVRKGWWVDENLESPLLTGLNWPGFPDVANADDGGDSKVPYSPYTNVKFGCFSIGTTANDEDMPLMRVEEMILIQAEAQANLGNDTQAKQIVTNFVQTYRDPSYNFGSRGFSTLDEIWFQRRVELWGEGFGVLDNLRLDKPIIRFNGDPKATNYSDSFRFNIESQDPWLRMRFPQGETNTNFAIVDNTGGTTPKIDQNPNLKDGVIAR